MRVRVHYPLQTGQLLLRADSNWEQDIAPDQVHRDRHAFDFQLPGDAPFRYFKPVVRDGDAVRWAQGDNLLVLGAGERVHVFPHFDPDSSCHECNLQEVTFAFTGRRKVRVFVPPGYDENVLERFPVLYMQDGHNLFFPEEAAFGSHWRVSETLRILSSMNLVRKAIVVGIYPVERQTEYTAPGYEDYGRFLVEELKPWIDDNYRTLSGARHTAVLGSSLGGVVSFYLAWQWPEVFGSAGCMSSTFGYRDDLFQRVLAEKPRPIRLYLDSGWPRDNYETTRSLVAALRSRGYHRGSLEYVAFPEAQHREEAWAARVHLPFQFLFADWQAPGLSFPPSATARGAPSAAIRLPVRANDSRA